MDPIKKSLNVIMLCIGLGIFTTVVLIKVEVMAEKCKADIHLIKADLKWEDYLIQQEIQKHKE